MLGVGTGVTVTSPAEVATAAAANTAACSSTLLSPGLSLCSTMLFRASPLVGLLLLWLLLAVAPVPQLPCCADKACGAVVVLSKWCMRVRLASR